MSEEKLPLQGLRIGISGAVPEREFWGSVVDLDRQILRFISQFSSLAMAYGGQIVHGSHPSFAPVVADAARRQRHLGSDESPLTLVASKLWGKFPEVALRSAQIAQAPVVLAPKVGEGDINDVLTRNRSLTAMRMVLTERIDVLVAVGGKLHRNTGYNPGVLEELAQAHWHNAPCFIVAGCGGMAGEMDEDLVRVLSAGNFLDEENPDLLALMASSNESIDAYVGKLLVHLASNRHRFIDNFSASEEQSRLPRFMRVKNFLEVSDAITERTQPYGADEWQTYRVDEWQTQFERTDESGSIRYMHVTIQDQQVKRSSDSFTSLKDAIQQKNLEAVQAFLQTSISSESAFDFDSYHFLD